MAQGTFILHGIRRNRHLRTTPMLLAIHALGAEIIASKTWVRKQAQALMIAQVQTGHHSYATTTDMEIRGTKSLDLATMSRDVCGLAVNISTRVLCLQRIVKLADFISDECSNVIDNAHFIPNHMCYLAHEPGGFGRTAFLTRLRYGSIRRVFLLRRYSR